MALGSGYNWQNLYAGIDAIKDTQNRFMAAEEREAARKQQQDNQNRQFGFAEQRLKLAQDEAKRAAAMDPLKRRTLLAQATRAEQGADPQFAYKQRAAAAVQHGLRPGTPEYQNFVLGGSVQGQTKFGMAPTVVQGNDGKFYALQFGSDGRYRTHPLDGMTPSRGVSTVDTGTGTQVIDKATGRAGPVIPKDIAGAEREKKLGQAAGTRIVNKPKATQSYWSAASQRKVLDTTIKEAIQMTGTFTAGLGGTILKNLPETAARDLAAKLDTIKANAGFEKLQEMRDNSPTGGALGQVTERELAFLQSVWASVEQAQSPQQLRQNLMRFNKIHAAALQRVRNAYKLTYGEFPPAGAMPDIQPQQRGSSIPGFDGFTIRPRGQ